MRVASRLDGQVHEYNREANTWSLIAVAGQKLSIGSSTYWFSLFEDGRLSQRQGDTEHADFGGSFKDIDASPSGQGIAINQDD